MMELLTINNVTVAGVLLCLCIYLIKHNDKDIKMLSKNHADKDKQLLDECKGIKEEHKKERKEWLETQSKIDKERSQERKEWLQALEKNTNELRNIANTLGIIPRIQHDVDAIKNDMLIIKTKIGTN